MLSDSSKPRSVITSVAPPWRLIVVSSTPLLSKVITRFLREWVADQHQRVPGQRRPAGNVKIMKLLGLAGGYLPCWQLQVSQRVSIC